MCAQVRPKVRSAALRHRPDALRHRAAEDILALYQNLAARGAHLLEGALAGEAPQAWAHYPVDDARDDHHGYQWFYHSHSVTDRPGGVEHGHLHVFARQPALRDCLKPSEERAWRKAISADGRRAKTRHLFCIGLDARGLPNSLFTVNSWVTGDVLPSSNGAMRLINGLQLHTGFTDIDRLIMALAKLCAPQLAELIAERDSTLLARAARGGGVLDDEMFEILSERRLDLDQIIQGALTEA